MWQILLCLVVVVLVARLILRGYKAEPVLLLAGLVLLFASQIFDWGRVLPVNAKGTGIEVLDLFEVIHRMFSSRAASLGLMIMALMGFAHYMEHIGANAAAVRVATRPLRRMKSPYMLLFFSFLLASLLQLAIPSATGLGVLLMGTMFPIMIGLGLSPASAAGVVASSLAIAYTPTAIDAIRGSAAVGMDVVEYVVYHQGPPALLTVLIVGVVHVFWQRYCDHREGFIATSEQVSEASQVSVPNGYALLPLLPIAMAIGSSSMIVSGINLNIVTIVMISMAIAMTVELFRLRDAKKAAAGFDVFLKGMGAAFATVVGLLVAAGVFAEGIKATGAISELVAMALNIGLPAFGMGVAFAIVTFAAAVIMGSGNAPFLAFVELIPQIAASMGASATSIILPMQQASHMGRAMSPVSGVVIAVASGSKLTPFQVVKRTAVPVCTGLVVHTILVGVMMG